jgi:hypothetical protein
VIAAQPGHVARFENGETRPVVAWNVEGEALVVDGDELRLADLMVGFAGVEEEQRIVGAVPGGGWRVRDVDGDEFAVIAWVIDTEGLARPIVDGWDGGTVPFGWVLEPGEISKARLVGPT